MDVLMVSTSSAVFLPCFHTGWLCCISVLVAVMVLESSGYSTNCDTIIPF